MTERIVSWLAQMTLEEKLAMLAGSDMWHAPGVARLGIPPLKLSDGPNGARGESFRDGTTAACFPCGAALGASWDPELIERVGAALGQEARSKSAHVLLAPTVNIHRSPLGGRNFECYSEDPWLSARAAVAFVRGVQSQGVGTTVKHFVCNDSEFERHTISSEVDERSLREIYLPPFEAAVREAHAWGIMSAYNKINGTWASEHARLLEDILRGEWGFDGFVISDWFGSNDTVRCANGGLDLEMPGPGRHFAADKLATALESGEIDARVIDAKVCRLLEIRERTGVLASPEEQPEQARDLPEHRALAREAAAASFVLLQNRDEVLPLDPEAIRTLALIGPNADVAIIQGGGSAGVNPHYQVSPLDGLRARLPGAEIVFETGCTNHKVLPTLDSRFVTAIDGDRGLRVEYFNNLDFSGEPALRRAARELDFSWFGAVGKGVDVRSFSARVTAKLQAPASGEYRFGLASAGRSRLLLDGTPIVENWDEQTRGDSFFGMGTVEEQGVVHLEAGRSYDLQIDYARVDAPLLAGMRAGMALPSPADQMERAVAAAARADAAVVVVGLNRDWETEGRDRVDMELPGRQAELIAKVCAANPRSVVVLNAGSPLRMPWLEQAPAVLQIWYPGQELGNALAEVLVGDRPPGGRLPTSFPKRLEDNPTHLNYPGEDGRVRYGEGLFVGYRYYDRKDVAPLFPFGHGLAYTRFEYGEASVSAREIAADDALEVRVEVQNTGHRAGYEVVQLYLRDVDASHVRPEKELRAFRKIWLEPGERRVVTLPLDRRSLSFYDPGKSAWLAEPGDFEVLIGASSRDIRARTSFRLKA